MSLLDYNLDNVPELTSVAEGEYQVQINSAEVKTNEKGNTFLLCRMSIPDEPAAQDLSYVVMLPNDNDEEKEATRKLNNLRRFMRAFGFDTSAPLDTDAMPGSTAFALLIEKDDPTYGRQNQVKKFTNVQ